MQPNMVLILADDLGYGDLGCYGQRQIQTPRIDRLAAEGIRFTQFYAGSTVCAPSRCVLMTGLHTGHCHIRGNARVDLRPEDVTVAEVLKVAGYTTGLVGKWGLGQAGSEGVPTRQGFDEFFGYLDQHHAHNYFPAFLWRNETRVPLKNVVPGDGEFGSGVASEKKEYSPDLMIREALSFIERHKDGPFFLYFASTLPHANNEAGKKGMEIPDYGQYRDRDWPEAQKGHAAMISRLDADVGRILDRLHDLKLDENTLVVFSSDNGPHREGGNDPNFFDSNGPLRGIKRDLYEGGIRVPFIVRWPGHAPAGKGSEQLGWFADFLPTAASFAFATIPDKLDGDPLHSEIHGAWNGNGMEPTFYWEFYERGSAQAVRMGKWKGVVKQLGGDRVELYNLSTDIGETQDVSRDHPEIVAKIRSVTQQSHTPSPLWQVRR
jgi:arylsulfatase A-like enzyme